MQSSWFHLKRIIIELILIESIIMVVVGGHGGVASKQRREEVETTHSYQISLNYNRNISSLCVENGFC